MGGWSCQTAVHFVFASILSCQQHSFFRIFHQYIRNYQIKVILQDLMPVKYSYKHRLGAI
jgi:hypothetical protein